MALTEIIQVKPACKYEKINAVSFT